MKPTKVQALKSAMRKELDDETYDKILTRADDIRSRN
jgi:hypothetical protein